MLSLLASVTVVSSWQLYIEDFDHQSTDPRYHYHDQHGHRCAHELESHDYGEGHRQRAVGGEQTANELGFATTYVDTLLADGSAALHSRTALLRLDGVRQPKPPPLTHLPPIQSEHVP